MLTQQHLEIATPGRSILNITDDIAALTAEANIQTGLCHIYIHHTSASLIICENFDPLVQRDLEAFMQRLVPDGDPEHQHVDEGPDDMPSHIRSVLTQTFLMIPITEGKLALGKWQGIYLWEHRLRKNHRKLTVTFQG